jgi:RHS repeat-associated protein
MTTGPKPDSPATPQVCTYDAWNRLMTVSEGSGTPTLVVTYSYDGRNRRIRKVVEGDPDVTYDYYYNESWQVLEVRKGEDPDPLEQYVWGAQYIDAPVVRFYDGDLDGLDPEDEDDSTLYYTYDGNFNVTAVIKPDGTVAERYAYDPYGQVTFKAADWSDAASQVKSAYDNEILYCGYRFDPESGNYIARNRYLHPTLGRWLTCPSRKLRPS